MIIQRRRAIWLAVIGLTLGWGVALTGYFVAQHRKMTSAKVIAYLRQNDLNRLSGEARAKALQELARKLNALSLEERRRARLQEEWETWFAAMTEQEKAAFIEATLPAGFKQMLNAFEQLPPEKRKQAVERSLRTLARTREAMENQESGPWPGRERTNRFGQLSPELQQKVINLGLKSFYNESSSQTRAELAPVLEEMQRQMESGALFRGHH